MEKSKEDQKPRKNYQRDRNQPRRQYEDKGIPHRFGPYPPRRERENIEVNVDTEIPPMPAKHELLLKPNWEKEYKDEYDRLLEEIRKLKREKVKYLEMYRVNCTMLFQE
jgi:hypothetical protein